MNTWSGRQNNGNHPIRTVEIKTNEKNESNKWDLWDNINHANVRIIGIQEGEEREKRIKNIFGEIYHVLGLEESI